MVRSFGRRMAPLALAAGIVVALLPPTLFYAQGRQRLLLESDLVANEVATRLSELAVRQPGLWRYNSRKIVDIADTTDRRGLPVAIDVTDCSGTPIYTAAQRGDARSVSSTATIVALGHGVGLVRAHVQGGDLASTTVGIGVVSGVIGLLLAVLLHVVPTRVVRRQARQIHDVTEGLREAREDLHAANRDLQSRVDSAVTQVRHLSRRVLDIQERERGRIARDVHDGVGQWLTALRIDIANARTAGSIPESTAAELSHEVEQAAQELRHVIQDLRPVDLNDGLAAALEALLERFERRTGILVSASIDRKVTPPEDVSAAMLRVAQEALTNVQRHAQATEVSVQLRERDGSWCLRIADDGIGFDNSSRYAGAGLGNMHDRMRLFGGDTSVVSGPEDGTTVEASLPTTARDAVTG
jgi:signal transduction histidine kinase